MILGFALGILAAVAFVAFLFATAPEGYEDEALGFQYGKPEDGGAVHASPTIIDYASEDDAGFWLRELPFASFPVSEFGDDAGRGLPDAEEGEVG